MNITIVWQTVILLIAQLVLAWLVYERMSRTVRDARRDIQRHADNTIAQIEALLSIHAELRPARPLPRSRGWAASPDFLAVLITLAHERKPALVVECSSGYSTLVLAATLRNIGRGKVFSLEHDPEYAARSRRQLEMHGLAAWAEVIDAPLQPMTLGDWSGRWYETGGLPEGAAIDMLVIDGPPQNTGRLARYPAVPALLPRLCASALVILDDADRPDELLAVDRWLAGSARWNRIQVPVCEKGVVALERLA